MHRRRRKAETVWRRGVYLGRAERTGEHLLGTAAGIFRARTVRRLPAEQRGDAERVRAVGGTPREGPWEPARGHAIRAQRSQLQSSGTAGQGSSTSQGMAV